VFVLAAACTFNAHVGAGEGGTDEGTTTTGIPDPSTSSGNGSMTTMPPGTSSSTSSDATSSSNSSDGGESNGSSSTTAAESESGITSGGCVPEDEVCDGVDNDCDLGIDEGSASNALCNECAFVPAVDGDYFALCPDPLEWDQARNACAGFGPTADLAVIDDATDQSGLLLLIGVTAMDHWVGISDIDEEGHWVFVDGTDSIVDGGHLGYDGWAKSQPSGGKAENCGELDPVQNGWADSPCDSPQPFICRHPP
jgi:hypothetical protein